MKLLDKKLAFKFSAYIFEYQPLSQSYVHLASTDVTNAPKPYRRYKHGRPKNEASTNYVFLLKAGLGDTQATCPGYEARWYTGHIRPIPGLISFTGMARRWVLNDEEKPGL